LIIDLGVATMTWVRLKVKVRVDNRLGCGHNDLGSLYILIEIGEKTRCITGEGNLQVRTYGQGYGYS